MNTINTEKKEKITTEFAKSLPTLRSKLDLTQQQLADKVGLTRQSIIAIEKGSRKMTWSMFLSMFFIFYMNQKTRPLIIKENILDHDSRKALFGEDGMIEKESMLEKASEMMRQLEKPES